MVAAQEQVVAALKQVVAVQEQVGGMAKLTVPLSASVILAVQTLIFAKLF